MTKAEAYPMLLCVVRRGSPGGRRPRLPLQGPGVWGPSHCLRLSKGTCLKAAGSIDPRPPRTAPRG